MAIDSRVAHGVAGRHLEDALKDSVRVAERIHTAIGRRSTRPATAKGAQRELREYKQPVAKHSLWWTETVDRHDGPFLAWLAGRGGADTLVITRHRFAPAAKRSLPAQMDDVGKLSLHAVARCLQRNGTLSWAAVKPMLAEAASSLVLMTDVANRLSLQQIAVPAGSGLFVGEFGAEDGPTMQTYIVLDETQPSRWMPVRKAILEALSASNLGLDKVCAQAAYEPRDEWWDGIDRLEEALAPLRWLRQQYDPRLDPVSAAWNDYRARTAGEADAVIRSDDHKRKRG